MKSIARESFEEDEAFPFFGSKISTGDIALSLEKFIDRNYRGIIRFSKSTFEDRFILFGDYELAEMIKAILKELTLRHTCKISFSTAGGDFLISFEAHEQSPPTMDAIMHLSAEAHRYGLDITVSERTLTLVIPTHEFSTRPIYNRDRLKFYSLLYSVFEDY